MSGNYSSGHEEGGQTSNSNGAKCCCPPVPPPFCCPPMGFGNLGCPDLESNAHCWKGQKVNRELRWPQCNFLKPCLDLRIYRREEWMNEYYTGHIPKDFSGPPKPTWDFHPPKPISCYSGW